jgi:predicted nucleic acid-binding protein
LRDGARRRQLAQWWHELVVTRFLDRMLTFDQRTAEMWGAIVAKAEARGKQVPIMDAIIAATARVHGLTVVTRNVSDIGRCGVQVLDPWKA